MSSGPLLRLASWRRADREIEFNPETGTGRVITLQVPRTDDTPISGFAQSERRVGGARLCFAVYRAGEEIYFHAGKRRWRLGTPRLRFEHHHLFPFVARFRVSGEDGGFGFSYVHIRRQVLAIMDLTYDLVDQETDYFLGFVADYASSPQWLDNVRTHWTSAT